MIGTLEWLVGIAVALALWWIPKERAISWARRVMGRGGRARPAASEVYEMTRGRTMPKLDGLGLGASRLRKLPR